MYDNVNKSGWSGINVNVITCVCMSGMCLELWWWFIVSPFHLYVHGTRLYISNYKIWTRKIYSQYIIVFVKNTFKLTKWEKRVGQGEAKEQFLVLLRTVIVVNLWHLAPSVWTRTLWYHLMGQRICKWITWILHTRIGWRWLPVSCWLWKPVLSHA